MKRNVQIAFLAAVGGAVVLRVFRGHRRGHGRPEPLEPAVDRALADAAQQAAGDQLAIQNGVEDIAAAQPSAVAKPWATFISDTLQPNAYLRLAQLFMALLTVVGSVVNGLTLTRGEPIIGIILTMGVVHISALEAILQTLGRAKVRQRAHAVVEAAPPAAAPPAAPVVDAVVAPGIPAAITDVLPYSIDQISGMWVKDRKRSDDMGPICDAMHMFGLLRHAVKIIKGTHVRFTPAGFDVAAVSVIPLLKIAERYPLDGTESKNRRRDQRGGGSWGRAEATPQGMLVHYRWGEPFAGTMRELFQLTPDGEMHLIAEGIIEGAPYQFTLIHRRAGAQAAA